MTREWSAEELIAFHTERLRVGSRVHGMWAAAHVYLGREWTQLDAMDAALLAAIAHAPNASRADPWCHPEPTRERRNHMLREMHRLGFIDEPTLEASLRAPLRLSPRPASWKPC